MQEDAVDALDAADGGGRGGADRGVGRALGEGGRWEELRLRLVEGGWWGEDGVGGHFAGWRFAAWVVGAVGSVVAEWIGRWWMGGVGVGRVVVCGRKRDAYSEPRQTKTQKGSISVSHVQRLKNFV